MAEGEQQIVDNQINSSLNKKPVTEYQWDIKLFTNQGYAAALCCVECGHPPKKSFVDQDQQSLCEECSKPLITSGLKIVPNPFADRMIAQAEIRCGNVLFDPNVNPEEKKEGEEQCEWKKLVKDWPEHNKVCPYTITNCTDCCEYKASRSLQPAHTEVCGFAVIVCPLNCGAHIQRKDTEHHTTKKCPKTIMQCTNDECKEELTRDKLHQHVTQLCCKRIVECKYSEFGCTQERIKHESMEQHMVDFDTKHIQYQLEILYRMMAKQQHAAQAVNQGPAFHAGMIMRFHGGDAIPDGWKLCDGRDGTPDLRDQFIRKHRQNNMISNNIKIKPDTIGKDEEFYISERDDDEEEDIEIEQDIEEENEYNINFIAYSMIYIIKV